MIRTLLSLALLLGLARPAAAQTVTLPDKVTVDQPGLVVIRASALDADDVRWFSVGPGLQTFPPDVIAPKPGVYLGFAMREGVYKVGVVCAKAVNGKAVLSPARFVTITVGTPPAPGPGPGPGPGPTPAPVPDAGMHVLIVYDAAKQAAMPAAQLQILSATAAGSVRDYLTKKCAQVGGKADWAIWPDGGDAGSYPSAPLKAMYARPRQSLPWIVISRDGSTGFEGPLPAAPAAALALLTKFGG